MRNVLKDGYLAYALRGALSMLLFAFWTHWNQVQEGRSEGTTAALLETMVVLVPIGTIAGIVSYALRAFGARSIPAEYARWTVAVAVATVLVGVPEAWTDQSVVPLLTGGFLGICVGLSLGAVAHYFRTNPRRESVF